MPKLSVTFNDRVDEMLEGMATKEGTTKVDIIRRALALYEWAGKEVAADPKRRALAITEDDKVIKEIVMP
jgi:hypothetical protein